MDHPIPVVRLIIPDSEGRVLILQRQRESKYAAGAWCLPGGKIEYNETAEATIQKELSEETSLTCTSLKFLFFQDSLPLAPGKMHCVNLYFECTVSGNLILNEESSAFAWIGPSDLKDYNISFRNNIALLRYWKERSCA
ncbi:MAG: NUDIX domain-containing protein [Acidobacteria bacterium]|nr:NUDIX domain-containing protein [Acidobacteriota bacterium]